MIVFIIFILLIDVYAFQAVKTVFDATPFFRNPAIISYWTISLAIYVLIVVSAMAYFNMTPLTKRIIMGAVICVGIAKLFIVGFVLVDDIGRLFKWIPSFAYRGTDKSIPEMVISRSEFINRLALITGGGIFGLFTWGMIRTAYQYKVHRVSLKFPQLPESFEGLRIVQISDLHLGSFLNTDPVKNAVEMINDLDPDVVFFTGDLVNNISAEAEPFIDALSGIRSKFGVYSVKGNHDYGKYHRWESKEEAIQNLNRLNEIHQECGWTLLNNDNRILDVGGAQIAVIGVENWGSSKHFPKAGDIDKAMEGIGNTNLKLLLSHDPSHWNYKVSKEYPDIDVTFSGHTHGFQMGVEIPWLNIKWSPSKYVYKQWAGLYQRGKQYLYVNRGLGFIGYHGRVGILPEITLLEIERA